MDTSDEVIVQVALADLVDSPSQPRDSLPNIPELAANIKAEGRIHSPLIVRPLPDGRLEVVFGHRRKYAALEAGLTTGPAVVRTMTDAEVRSAQMTENIQREAMKAIEEAKGFQAQIDNDGLSVRTLAERIGKSASFVGGRLRLLDLCPEVRTALLAGEIEAEVALYIARVGGVKLQQKALGYIKAKYWDLEDGGEKSVRQIRELLNERFTLQLDKALFDPEDEMLVPLAGNCVRCPKRSGNAPEFADITGQGGGSGTLRAEFADELIEDPKARRRARLSRVKNGGTDVCTDPDCFDAKKKAALKREADKLQAAGKIVVDGNKARAAIDVHGNVKGAYIAVKDVKAELQAVAAANKPQVVTLQNPRDGKTVQAYKVDDLKAAGVKGVERKHAANTAAHYEAERRKRQEEEARNEAKAKAENAVRMAMLAKVREAIAASPRKAFDLRLIAPMVLSAVNYHSRQLLAEVSGFTSREAMERKLGQLDTHALTLFMLDCALVDDLAVKPYNLKTQPEALLLTAKEYGVDLDAVRAQFAEDAPAPPPAAQAKKSAATGGKTAKVARGVKYRNPMTGETWTGRGLQPAWLKAALARGATLAGFAIDAGAPTPPPAAQAKSKASPKTKGKAGKASPAAAGDNQKDEAGSAGLARDPNTADMFEEAQA